MRRREFLGSTAGAGLAAGAVGEPSTAGVAMDVADLDRAVQSALGSQRLGAPVFVRLTWHSVGKGAEPLTRLAALAGRWLGQAPVRLQAAGGKGGPASVTVLYAAGASAVVSVSGGQGTESLDLLLLGSRGALHHAGAGFEFNDKTDPVLLNSIRRALSTGDPTDVKEAP